MALTFGERYDTTGAVQGQNFIGFATQSHTRKFNVPGAQESDALAHPDLLTALATDHPRFPGLVPVGVKATEHIGANEGWIVEVEYGVNRLSGGSLPPPPDTTDISYYSQELSTRGEEITIPVMGFTPVYMVVPGPVPTYAVVHQNWKRYDIIQPLVRTQYSVRLNVTVGSRATMRAYAFTIAAQTWKIHEFGGLKWLFQGGQADERETGVWQIVYTWLSDPGSPELTIPTAPGATQAMLTTPERPPFHQYIVRNYTNNQNLEFFDITTVATHEEDLSGYASLPGAPI